MHTKRSGVRENQRRPGSVACNSTCIWNAALLSYKNVHSTVKIPEYPTRLMNWAKEWEANGKEISAIFAWHRAMIEREEGSRVYSSSTERTTTRQHRRMMMTLRRRMGWDVAEKRKRRHTRTSKITFCDGKEKNVFGLFFFPSSLLFFSYPQSELLWTLSLKNESARKSWVDRSEEDSGSSERGGK